MPFVDTLGVLVVTPENPHIHQRSILALLRSVSWGYRPEHTFFSRIASGLVVPWARAASELDLKMLANLCSGLTLKAKSVWIIRSSLKHLLAPKMGRVVKRMVACGSTPERDYLNIVPQKEISDCDDNAN